MKKVIKSLKKEKKETIESKDVSEKRVYLFKGASGFGSIHKKDFYGKTWKHYWFDSAYTEANSGSYDFSTLQECVEFWIKNGKVYEFDSIQEAITWLHSKYKKREKSK